MHELELQSDLAGDSTISALGKYVLAGQVSCLASSSSDRKAEHAWPCDRGVIWGDISRPVNGENVLGGVAYKNK